MATKLNSKDRLYEKYVSSEQAGKIASGGIIFKQNAPYIKALRKFIPSIKDINILDLGCGHGTYLHFLKKWGYKNVEGCDLSREQVELAHSLGIPEVKEGNIFTYLKEREISYDVILLMDVIEHLTNEECFEILDLAYASLNTNGILIIHVPNAEGVFGMKIRYGDLTHENAFTSTSLRQLLKTIGFMNLSFFEERPIIHGLKSFLRRIIYDLLTLPIRLLYVAETGSFSVYLSQNILCVAKKD